MGPGSRPRPDLRLPRHIRHWLLRDSEAEAVAVFGGGGVDQLWFVDRWRRAAMGVVLLIASIVFILSLRLWAPPDREPKLRGVHPTTPAFLRLAYAWLVVAAGLAIIAGALPLPNGC